MSTGLQVFNYNVHKFISLAPLLFVIFSYSKICLDPFLTLYDFDGQC